MPIKKMTKIFVFAIFSTQNIQKTIFKIFWDFEENFETILAISFLFFWATLHMCTFDNLKDIPKLENPSLLIASAVLSVALKFGLTRLKKS